MGLYAARFRVVSTMSIAQGVLGLAPVEKVRFTFETAEDAGLWRVVELRASEGLSELYSCTLELANEDVAAGSDELLGISCTVSIARGVMARRICGIVHRIEHLGARGGHALVRVHVVPALWSLSQKRDAYIFQEMTVPEILEEVLGEGLKPFDRACRLALQREYLPREYCVQYHETDLDFVLRLMEEEGIGFYFDHSGENEELVLFDDSSQCAACETALGMPVTLRRSEGMTTSDETLRAFEFVQQMRSTNVVVRDFDWTQPQVDVTNKAGEADQHGHEREVYEYPTPLVGPYDGGSKRYKHDRAHQAQLHREALEVLRRHGSGKGDVLGFTAGYSFELTGYSRPDLDQKYLLTRVEHLGHAPDELLNDAQEQPEPGKHRERYSNNFECIPFTVPYRPERKKIRARMNGLQTGTVVGPSGQEIHTDEHGRIKVQFHWDREGQRDEHSSCFLRVVQSWAGAGFGTFFLPRIGMEVLIDFLEGDPDRPIVVGCVYNGQNPPPYPPPDNKTRSTLRTQSSPGGDGYNELRFEDAAGEEEVFFHAQKDFNETVENNHSTTVHANQTNTVNGNQTQSVGGDQTEHVTGHASVTVDKNHTVHVKGSQNVTIDGEQANGPNTGGKLSITGAYGVEASKTIKVQAPENIKLICGDSSILIEPGKITITAGGQAQVVLDANALMKSSANSNVLLDADAEMKSSGNSNVLLKATAEMKAQGGGTVTLSADAVMTSKGGSKVSLDGSALLHGAGKALVDAPDVAAVQGATAKIKGDGGSVTADASGVNASGGSATISGDSAVTVTGGMIKLN